MAAGDRRLGVIDRFHLTLHREGERAGAGPATCALVAELDGRADVERLRQRVDDVAEAVPELRWRLGRSRWWRQPRWQVDGEAEGLEVLEIQGDVLATAEDRLATGLGPERPWRLELWRGSERDALALRWFHPLSDALGASRLLACLGGDEAIPEDRFAAPEDRLAKLDWRKRLALTRAYGEHALTVARAGAILSPRRLAGGSAAGRPRIWRIRFTEEQTAAFVASLRSRARLADTSLLLRATARFYAGILRARGAPASHHMVPVPLSFDPKRGSTRMFGNNVTMMMLGLDDATLDDEPATVADLAAQQRAIVRGKLDLAMIAALDTLRAVPDAPGQWLAKSPFDGQRCSFILSNPGALSLPPLAGCRVSDAFAVAAASPDPGLVVIGQRFGPRMSVVFSWCEGFFAEDELRGREEDFRRDLLGG
jgi:hypothetical protein